MVKIMAILLFVTDYIKQFVPPARTLTNSGRMMSHRSAHSELTALPDTVLILQMREPWLVGLAWVCALRGKAKVQAQAHPAPSPAHSVLPRKGFGPFRGSGEAEFGLM